jgi:hypothetical protein
MTMPLAEPLIQEHVRDQFLKQIHENPHNYYSLDAVYQSDRQICLATIMAFDCNNDDHDEFLFNIFEIIFTHLPKFVDHQAAFFRFVELGKPQAIELYLEKFGIEQNLKVLKKALARDKTAALFDLLEVELQSNPELLAIALENVLDSHILDFLNAVPPEALVQHELILFRILERDIDLTPDQLPPSFWENRDFVIKWANKKKRMPISFIPTAFKRDREVCLSLYRNQTCRRDSFDYIDWIAKPFFADKRFILECLSHHPMIFDYCDQELRDDFDVFLEAAYRAIVVRSNSGEFARNVILDLIINGGKPPFTLFLEDLGESVTSRSRDIRNKLEAHDEFMTLLACSRKSTQLSLQPLSSLDCDDETARGLKTMIGRYLGFSGATRIERLKRVWAETVFLAVGGETLTTKLMPLVRPQTLVRSVLKAIECQRHVSLAMYPVELWTNRLFVKWAATKGMINKAVPHELSSDPEICLAYYKHSLAIREAILPWISESLKTNRDFVLKCVSISPLILNDCKNDDILHDFEVMQIVVRDAVRNDKVDVLAGTALEHDWADALVFFAKSLRAKIQAHSAVEAFGDRVGSRYFAQARAVRPLIGSYLGICPNATELFTLQEMWSHRSIFFLALGGSVKELFQNYKYRSKRKRNDDEPRYGNW